MTRLNSWKRFLAIFLFCAVAAILSSAQTFTTLTVFDGTDGQGPNGPLSQGLDGELYGATYVGGSNGYGTVFKITAEGTLTTFNSPCAGPVCPLEALGGLALAASGGDFYGMTEYGGANGDYGTVFRITPSGQMTNMYNFCSQPKCTDGDSPFAGLAPSSDGNFYGTTSGGGAIDNSNCLWGCGTVFKMNPAGKLTTLYSFFAQRSCTDGRGHKRR
jgi:uncharacterized repeat protein (TIGR03803 family)